MAVPKGVRFDVSQARVDPSCDVKTSLNRLLFCLDKVDNFFESIGICIDPRTLTSKRSLLQPACCGRSRSLQVQVEKSGYLYLF